MWLLGLLKYNKSSPLCRLRADSEIISQTHHTCSQAEQLSAKPGNVRNFKDVGQVVENVRENSVRGNYCCNSVITSGCSGILMLTVWRVFSLCICSNDVTVVH